MHRIKENLKAHIEQFCLKYPSRHVGSEGERAATDYVEKKLNEYGYSTKRESFPVRGWDFEEFEFYNETEDCAVPTACVQYFSGSVDFRGRLLFLSKEDIPRLSDIAVEGAVCYVDAIDIGAVFAKNAISEELERLGALRVIFISHDYIGDFCSTKATRSPFIESIATAAVTPIGAIYIKSHEDDIYHLKVKARAYDTSASNIVATLGGGSKKIVVGAHPDAAPLIQGAGDNASGTAILLEAARLLRDTDTGEYQIDFATFNAEEYIARDYNAGSYDYYDRRRTENITCLVNVDDFGVHYATPTFYLYAPQKLPKLGYRYETVVKIDSIGDEKVFYDHGIPSIFLHDVSLLKTFIHSAADSVALMDYDKMADGVIAVVDIIKQLIKQ